MRRNVLQDALAMIAVALGILVSLAGPAVAASSVYLCVPEKAGAAVKSGGTAGICKEKFSKVALPAVESEQQKLLALLPHLSYAGSGVGGKPTIRFSGVNVQVVDGAGTTRSATGTGNVILGYDENTGGLDQSGSHNLVLGEDQTFSSYGGFVGGHGNSITGPFDSVFGGGANASTAGEGSTVAGGVGNTASGNGAFVAGGYQNVAGQGLASVVGGEKNTAASTELPFGPTIVGGRSNLADFGTAVVVGGVGGRATNEYSVVGGGESNQATGAGAWVGGGSSNTASGAYASIFGGHELMAPGEFDAMP
jgi:hypothetical protein